MNANEIVKKLRLRVNTFSTTPECDKTLMEDAADLIESLQAKNKALLREVCNLACESVEREKTLAKLESAEAVLKGGAE